MEHGGQLNINMSPEQNLINLAVTSVQTREDQQGNSSTYFPNMIEMQASNRNLDHSLTAAGLSCSVGKSAHMHESHQVSTEISETTLLSDQVSDTL